MSNKLITTDPISMELWSKDHWSLLLYIETCVVDAEGRVNSLRLRRYDRKNREYPTTLKDGSIVWLSKMQWHDDYNCMDDLETAGLMENRGTGVERIYTLTDYGWKLAHILRRNRADKVKDKDFMPPAQEENSKIDVHERNSMKTRTLLLLGLMELAFRLVAQRLLFPDDISFRADVAFSAGMLLTVWAYYCFKPE